uniref:Uncharacterized protein n=1 Tax=Triticum urartu TaxID=4572 RepID=A0A8R7Q4W7_TRIUA
SPRTRNLSHRTPTQPPPLLFYRPRRLVGSGEKESARLLPLRLSCTQPPPRPRPHRSSAPRRHRVCHFSCALSSPFPSHSRAPALHHPLLLDRLFPRLKEHGARSCA